MIIVRNSRYDHSVSKRELFFETDLYLGLTFPSMHGSCRGVHSRVVRGSPPPDIAPFRIDRKTELSLHLENLHPETVRSIIGKYPAFFLVSCTTFFWLKLCFSRHVLFVYRGPSNGAPKLSQQTCCRRSSQRQRLWWISTSSYLCLSSITGEFRSSFR